MYHQRVKIVDMANDLWKDLGNPPDQGIAYISTWLRQNVGKLNNHIAGTFILDPSTQEIIQQYEQRCNAFYWGGCTGNNTFPSGAKPYYMWAFGIDEADIFKEIFKVKYYEFRINSFLYAGQYDTIKSVSEGDSSASRITKLDLAKQFQALKKDCEDRLIYLAHLYKFNKATAVQVQGNDFITPAPYSSVGDYGPGWYY